MILFNFLIVSVYHRGCYSLQRWGNLNSLRATFCDTGFAACFYSYLNRATSDMKKNRLSGTSRCSPIRALSDWPPIQPIDIGFVEFFRSVENIILTFGELKWDVLSSSQKTCRITNDNNAIEEWTFEKGGTCHIFVTHFGLQFTFHRKSRSISVSRKNL